jgi:hypothetical protein
MNRRPIAATDRLNESHAQFLAIFPLARRAAEVRTAAAVARATVAPADREDLAQEALVAVWRGTAALQPLARLVANVRGAGYRDTFRVAYPNAPAETCPRTARTLPASGA